MFQIQFPVPGPVAPSQVEGLFVELNDEQLGTVTGGVSPVGGWGSANSSMIPVGGW
jgi:hypothetical protein